MSMAGINREGRISLNRMRYGQINSIYKRFVIDAGFDELVIKGTSVHSMCTIGAQDLIY